MSADTQKKNRTLQYNFNWGRIFDDAGGASSTLAQRRAAFTNTLNAEILLENCDVNEIQGAKFNPRHSGDGTVVWYGSGVYDWYAPGTGSNQNVKKLIENTLLYLAGESGLAVDNINKSAAISIYPNPVSTVLNIKTEGDLQAEIYDMNGRKLMTAFSKSINIQDLKAGVYTITVKQDGKSTAMKFVKK